jgi:ATP-dependent Clp protease protease subunit
MSEEKEKSKIIFMFEEFTSVSCQRIVREIIEKVNNGNDNQKIRIFLNSPGGIVVGLISIIDTINMIQNEVEITCVGQAASCGAILLSNGTKGHRFITKNSRVLLHQLSSGSYGHVKDIEIDSKELNRLNESIIKILSKNTGQSVSTLKHDMQRDLWLNAEQAVKYGLADKII